MKKVVICGGRGKMGLMVFKLCWSMPVSGDDDVLVTGVVEKSGHSDIGRPVGPNMVKVVDNLKACINEADVVIDFTEPVAAAIHASIAAIHDKAMVIGTTGFSEDQMRVIKVCAESIPIVLAPNFSIGANVMFYAVAQVAKLLGDDYDVEIIEAHHNQKKDAPSGTALKLKDVIDEVSCSEHPLVYGRKGVCLRTKGEVGILSSRGGGVPGKHTVSFYGQDEFLEITHFVLNRQTFARGAIQAARWVVDNKPSGLYDMQDVLGIWAPEPE